ncbi:ATP-binding protein [Salimicrobium humidisoli]|uniref:histidine kinase n=1 Tax=Salimicrobium humidisoli TaxID=2029857 RepID=A0ABX4HUI3_9BACI|nr:ATP-binding protein [Salimicrobium humidisoli]PBB06753.1 hypothetical protein CKW00_01720 [Salimicrobium humidisoli]
MCKQWMYYILGLVLVLGVTLMVSSISGELYTLPEERTGAKLIFYSAVPSSFYYVFFFVIIPSLYFVTTVMISAFIHRRIADTLSIRLLIAFLLTLALGYVSAGGTVQGLAFSTLMNSAAFISAPVIFIHFLYRYFAEIKVYFFTKRIYQIGYVVLSGSLMMDVYRFVSGESPFWIDQIQYFVLLIFYIFIFIVVCRGAFRLRTSSYRSFFKYISFGVALSFAPYLIFYLIPKLFTGAPIIGIEIAVFFLIALPITFLYLLSKQKLIDINFIIRRLRHHAFLSLLPSLLIAIMANLIIDWTFSLEPFLQLLFAGVVVLTLIMTFAEVMDFRMQSGLFSDRGNFQESLHKLMKNFKDQYSVGDLMNEVCHEITKTLKLTYTNAYSYHTKDGMFCVNEPILENLLRHLKNSMHNRKLAVGEIVETRRGFGFVIAESLNKVTVIYSTGKQDFTSLNREERKYLQIISMNANIAIENMSHIEELMKQLQKVKSKNTDQYPAWLSRLLFQIAEDQREQLSIDIHDTVLQELLYLYRRMDELHTNREELPLTLRTELSVYKEQLLDSIHLTRETCSELRPTFLKEIGLIQSLDSLIQQYQLRSNFTVYFCAEDFHSELDQEMILTTYRIVQELLANAVKHSEAKHVHLYLAGNEEDVTLRYEDDGVGMENKYEWDAFTHIGLSGIEHRVNGLGGSLRIDTAEFEGFRMEIGFPLKGKECVE